jgi:hypothetical protein
MSCKHSSWTNRFFSGFFPVNGSGNKPGEERKKTLSVRAGSNTVEIRCTRQYVCRIPQEFISALGNKPAGAEINSQVYRFCHRNNGQEAVRRTFRLWDALNFPDICSWPTALEAKFTGFSSATEKRGLLYTSRFSDPQQREKRKQGLQPSEIKALRFAPIPSSALAPEGTLASISFTRL